MKPLLIVLLLFLAGCSQPNNQSKHSTESMSPEPTTSDSLTTSRTSRPDGQLNETLPKELILEDCTGWFASINYPASTSPGERPKGWTADTDGLLTMTALDAYLCNRVSLGRFERGPVHLIFEEHSNVQVPQSCYNLASGANDFLILRQLWIDDVELAAFLSETYGIPVVAGTFTITDEDVTAAETHTWAWAAPGAEASTMAVVYDKRPVIDPPVTEHFFWQNANGIGQLDLIPDGEGSQGDRAGNGTLHPPTLFASDFGGAFLGTAKWHPERHAAGLLTLYDTLECKNARP